MKIVKISRRWVHIVNYRSARWTWTYDYAFNAGMPPAVEVAYGTSLVSLRRMLRCRYPGHRQIETWRTHDTPTEQ